MYRLQSQHLSLVWLVGALIGVTLQSPLFYAFSFLLLPFFYLYLLIGVGLFCFVTVLGFPHSRGHYLKGGYDVQNADQARGKTGTEAVHIGVQGRRGASGA